MNEHEREVYQDRLAAMQRRLNFVTAQLSDLRQRAFIIRECAQGHFLYASCTCDAILRSMLYDE